MNADLLQLHQPQTRRLTRFSATASVDMHCHCLPGIDDGPPTVDAAIRLCRALVADGITAVIATPHRLGPYEHVTADAVRHAVTELTAELARLAVPLIVRAGAEIRADPRMAAMLAADELMTLADGRAYVLVELPHSSMIDLRPMIDTLVATGVTPIVAHPERHLQLSREPHLLTPWVAAGALLQVTAASLTGGFGPAAQGAAWTLLDGGLVSLVASDAHDTQGRAPGMTDAIDTLAARVGHAVTRRLCVQNPLAVFQGTPVPRPRVTARHRGRA